MIDIKKLRTLVLNSSLGQWRQVEVNAADQFEEPKMMPAIYLSDGVAITLPSNIALLLAIQQALPDLLTIAERVETLAATRMEDDIYETADQRAKDVSVLAYCEASENLFADFQRATAVTRAPLADHPKNESMALIANNAKSSGLVLEVKERCALYYDIDAIGNDLSDLGLDDAPSGLSIWEGYAVDLVQSYYDSDIEHELHGTFRALTVAEWDLLRTGKPLFPPSVDDDEQNPPTKLLPYIGLK